MVTMVMRKSQKWYFGHFSLNNISSPPSPFLLARHIQLLDFSLYWPGKYISNLFHVSSGFLPCFFWVSPMFLSGFFHVSFGFLPCFFRVSSMFLSGFFHVSFGFLPCFFRVSSMFLSGFFHVSFGFLPLSQKKLISSRRNSILV